MWLDLDILNSLFHHNGYHITARLGKNHIIYLGGADCAAAFAAVSSYDKYGKFVRL